ncbi:MAG TPA: hypothetical protein VGB18_07910 [Candidatus Thermoplasmatota archaeon]
MRLLPLSLTMLLLGAVLVVPASTAQTTWAAVTVFTELDQLGDDGRLRPETEELVGSVWAHISVPALSFCVQSIPAIFKARMVPGYASVAIKDPVQYVQIEPSAAPTTYAVKTLVSISTTRDAPAYEDGLYQFEVQFMPSSSLAGGCNIAPSRGMGSAIIENDYVPGIRLGEATIEHEGLSGWIDVPIENHANGPTRVRAILESESPDSFVVLNANDVVLESRAIKGVDAAWSGVMRIGYVLDSVEMAPISVRFLAGHDQGQSELETSDATYWAIGTLPEGGESTESERVEPLGDGSVESLPGPSIPILMLVGAVLLALARRCRQ